MQTKIKNIADIRTGYQFRGKIEHKSNGTHKVIQIRDINEDRTLNKEHLITVKLSGKVERHLVHKDDILFLSRGQNNYAVLITEALENTTATGYFFILRLNSANVLPEYLACYLNLSTAQRYINNLARQGTRMPIVPMAEFQNLKIDIPDIETQKSIVELSKLLDKENLLVKELQEKRTQLMRSLITKAIKKK